MITVKVNDRQVLDALSEIVSRIKNPRPALKEIGEDLTDSTKRRFTTATAPDGSAWAANSPVTLDRYLGTFKNSRKKDGTLSKAGQARSSSKKPLTGETKSLQRTINYQLDGSTGVRIGSPMVYAAMQQEGGKKSEFPHLWGDIPARKFLGLSPADSRNVTDIISSYLTA
jgi:phage virion morphogenesis protein